MNAKRFTTQENATVEVYGKSIEPMVAQIKDLSQTGACLQWGQANGLAKGELVRLTVYLKDLNKIRHISAEVIWSNDGKSGVQFLNQDQLFEKMLTKDF